VALLETLVLTVGPAIAKSILKSWLQDSDLAASASSSLVDLLSAKTKDGIARQKGSRQFEAIGEKVAESLLPLFEESRLEENSQIAIALAVAETLNNTPLKPALLVQKDLNPAELANFLIEANRNVVRDFSAGETALYKRIIVEVSGDVVDIASNLPRFTERTFAEILKRENQLLSVVNNILEEVSRIREESQQANPEMAAARFEEEYRRAVIRVLDELELFGADVSSASRRHRLSVAYVTLSVTKEVSSKEAMPISLSPSSSIQEEQDDDEAQSTVSVDEALAEARCLIVRGSAGSGKTTLLKWVAVRSASRSFENGLSHWNNTIPFFIRLRQCVEGGLPAPEKFPALLVPAISGIMPAGWVHTQLQSDRAVVLIDGIDEVSQLKRPEVRVWLKQLAETYDQAKFIVSSRPHAIEEGWLTRENFDDAELQPMELSDIDQFIDHWHRAVQEELQDQEEIAAIEDLASTKRHK
jgi:predicted NACHT family NTPase